ncbi:VOC family protein [Yoonia vestfoldensis]|uniref:VOC family protein n=1 Tax=Yoonia vestfoldensis TaxID=245188 RepID=UPI000477471B|nr:VOC family protein [Yoonia vestfoldensis]
MTQSLQIDYVEFYSDTLEATQAFFATAFGWDFVDYGPDYRDIQGAGIGGGLERAAAQPPLVVLHADDLQAAYDRISAAGAEITKEIFDFPGGRRFEFREPGGTAMAVWTKA